MKKTRVLFLQFLEGNRGCSHEATGPQGLLVHRFLLEVPQFYFQLSLNDEAEMWSILHLKFQEIITNQLLK